MIEMIDERTRTIGERTHIILAEFFLFHFFFHTIAFCILLMALRLIKII